MKRVAFQGVRKLAVPLLALAAGLVSAWAVREHVRQRVEGLRAEARTPLVRRLVAARDLPAGTVLEAAQLAVREVPTVWAPAASIEPQAIDSVLGARLGVDLASGELLLKACLGAADPAPSRSLATQIQPGLRAFMVPATDLGGLAGLLREGDAIDIYTSRSYRGHEAIAPVLQGLRVLSTTANADGEGGVGITLAARPDEAMRYLSARQAGTLTAVLRSRNDPAQTEAAAGRQTWGPIEREPTSRRVPGVTILYGDRPDERTGTQAAVLADFESEHP